MKKSLITIICLVLLYTSTFAANRYWVAPFTGNWSDAANWSAISGGPGGASVPTIGDFVFFNVNSLGNCNLDMAAAFDGINTTGYAGIIDLQGFAFNPSVSGTELCRFMGGTINDTPGTSEVNYTTTGTTYFNSVTFGAILNITGDRIEFNGGVFNAAVTVNKTGAASTYSAGGCLFNDKFAFTNSGTGLIYMSNVSPDTFNGEVVLSNTGTSTIRIAQNGIGNIFNENIYVNSLSGSGVYFGNGIGTSSLASGKTISVGVDGFTVGDLRLSGFTQVGSTPQTIILTGDAILRLADSTVFNGGFIAEAPQLYISKTHFKETVILQKTGVGTDYSNGGNVFDKNVKLINTGGGYLLFSYTDPDAFKGDLEMINSGTGRLSVAHNSFGNTVSGDLSMVNTGFGGEMRLSSAAISSLVISGNLSVLSESDSTLSEVFIGNSGHVEIGGRLDILQNATGKTSRIYVGNNESSSVIIGETAKIVNNGGDYLRRIYLGNSGDIIFNDSLIIENNATASYSEVFLNLSTESVNEYNGHIVLSNTGTGVNGNGIIFGQNNGSGTLAATKEVTIGTDGFIDGILQFRNFKQIGSTPQTMELTGLARFINQDSEWDGDMSIVSPRLHTGGTSYHGLTYLEKTGVANDYSSGGNIFDGDVELKMIGSGGFFMGNTVADTFALNVLVNNEADGNVYIATNSPGNYIAGNLTINNIGTGIGNATVSISNGVLADIIIEGNINIENIGNADVNTIYLGNTGDLILNGDLSINHSPTGLSGNLYLAYNVESEVTLNGTTTIDMGLTGGITKRVYLGIYGKIIFNKEVTIRNNSNATNNHVYLNYYPVSQIVFNGNLTIESTHPDGNGFLFGYNGGSAFLADSYTIQIGPGGFIAGDLFLQNFTQDGSTPQILNATGTSYFRQYYSDWGGNVNFSGGRYYTRETRYRGTTYIEKNGVSDDNSYGGNMFDFDVEVKNTGTGALLMGNILADTFQNNVLMNAESLGGVYVAANSPGNYIGGDLTINNNGTGAVTVTVGAAIGVGSGLIIDGNVVLNNTGDANTMNLSFAMQGAIIINGDLTIDHSPTGTNGTIYLANSTGSTCEVNGETNIMVGLTGGTIKRSYISQSGNSIFNGDFSFYNHSNATYNNAYISVNVTGYTEFNGNVVLESTNIGGNGFNFGGSGGTTLLANPYTVTVGPGGFVAGNLQFQNFTQDGPTPQNIIVTGTSYMRHQNSDWGGDVVFKGPQFNTRDTRYRGTAFLEKTGAVNDPSSGGNVFDKNTILKNSGTEYFMMGNGNFDLWKGDLDILVSGSGSFYLAHNSAGNIIEGDLDYKGTSVGLFSPTTYFSTHIGSTLKVGGNTIIANNTNGLSNNIYLGDNGEISFLGDLTILNSSASTNATVFLGNGANSVITVAGNTIVKNDGVGGNQKNVILGYNGNIEFNGTLSLSNSAIATISTISANERVNSNNVYNQNIILNCPEALTEGIYFGRYDGKGTLAAGRTITIGADNFLGKNLLFRNFKQLGSTPQILEPILGITRFENNSSEWNGNVTFTSARHYTNYTRYNADAILNKIGAGDDNSTGGNVFNGTTLIKNSGTGYIMPSNGVGNDFNGDVTYEKTSSGLIYPAYNASSTYAGSISVNSNTAVTFGAASGGRVIMDGTSPQAISVIGLTPRPRFRDLETNNPIAEITLNTPIEVITELDLIRGNVMTTMTNMLFMNDNAIVTNVSDNAFVDGPLTKIGNDVFVFPVGKEGVYRPISLASAPANVTAQFRAEYFPRDVVSDGISDLPVEPTIHHISDCEYWMLDRLVTTNSVVVGLYYKDYSPDNCSGVEVQADLVVSRWNGSIWIDHGNGGFGGTPADGWVNSVGPISAFSPFTLGTITALNPLPIELVSFNVTKKESSALVTWITKSEINNDYFEVQRSANGINFETIAHVKGAGNSSHTINYEFLDRNPYNGINYYRLKQVDFDGAFSYSKTESIVFNTTLHLSLYPNPLNAGNELTILSNHIITKVEIHTETGQLVFKTDLTESLYQTSFTNTNLVPGFYLVKVYSSVGVNIEKLIVQ